MTEKQPPRLSRNLHQPTDCAVTHITPGATAVISVGEPSTDERLYAVTKPFTSTPTSSRCRLALLEKMHNAGIRDAIRTSPCSFCQAQVEEIIPKGEN